MFKLTHSEDINFTPSRVPFFQNLNGSIDQEVFNPGRLHIREPVSCPYLRIMITTECFIFTINQYFGLDTYLVISTLFSKNKIKFEYFIIIQKLRYGIFLETKKQDVFQNHTVIDNLEHNQTWSMSKQLLYPRHSPILVAVNKGNIIHMPLTATHQICFVIIFIAVV